MNYVVYALQSLKDGRIYVGMTRDLTRRVQEHNLRQVFSTKGYCPWKLIFSELCNDRLYARIREKYWKSGIGKEKLKAL